MSPIVFVFSCVEHIINQVIRLFSLGSIAADPNAARILPLHFVALLDPQSNWFRAWMVGFKGFFSLEFFIYTFEYDLSMQLIVVLMFLKH